MKSIVRPYAKVVDIKFISRFYLSYFNAVSPRRFFLWWWSSSSSLLLAFPYHPASGCQLYGGSFDADVMHCLLGRCGAGSRVWNKEMEMFRWLLKPRQDGWIRSEDDEHGWARPSRPQPRPRSGRRHFMKYESQGNATTNQAMGLSSLPRMYCLYILY